MSICSDVKDLVPSPKELEDIWSYMVYHLNYSKSLNESRKAKQEQFLKSLEYISDVVAPGDAFALHYRIELMQLKFDTCEV